MNVGKSFDLTEKILLICGVVIKRTACQVDPVSLFPWWAAVAKAVLL